MIFPPIVISPLRIAFEAVKSPVIENEPAFDSSNFPNFITSVDDLPTTKIFEPVSKKGSPTFAPCDM